MIVEFVIPEYWKDLIFPGIDPNKYSISNKGRIKIKNNDYILAVNYSEKGYAMVRLDDIIKRRSVTKKLHRLVAYNFLGTEYFSNMTVDHIDGDKKDNSENNLEYVSFTENIRRSYKLGLNVGLRGERNGSSKITESAVREICERIVRGSMSSNKIVADLKDKYPGITKYMVDDIRVGKTWKEVSTEYGIRVK